MPNPSFEDVFRAVMSGTATHGILPVENSIGGSIHRNFDLLAENDLSIIGEVSLLVEHCLLAYPGTTREALRRIYSHPQALAQCERFLMAQPTIEIVATYDTAGRAKLIRDGALKDTGAIASARAGKIFGLEILASGIQDYELNLTRFVIVARQAETDPEADKTTIVFALPNQPGALFKALSVCAAGYRPDQTESRPIRGRPWEHVLRDLSVGRQDLRCARALVHLAEFAKWVRTLGSHKKWKSAELYGGNYRPSSRRSLVSPRGRQTRLNSHSSLRLARVDPVAPGQNPVLQVLDMWNPFSRRNATARALRAPTLQ
jgi:prephenate dehydratase